MEKIYLTDFMRPEQGLTHESLQQWQRKFPASQLLNMFCLKDATVRTSARQKAKMLLTLPDKLRFDVLPLEIAPIVEVREKPKLNIVETKAPQYPLRCTLYSSSILPPIMITVKC